jgi:predicted ATP-grasp superfamily ATP-dependent carboligase
MSWVSNGMNAQRLRCIDVVSHEEATRVVDTMAQAGGSVVLQEWLPGDRDAVSFLYDRGRCRAMFAQRAMRMDPPLGGASVVRESIAPPSDIVSGAQRLVEAIGLDGYSEVEFRRDASGVPRLMEVNPRLSASVEVAVRSGVDFPRLLCSWATGARVDAVQSYRRGVRMRWLGGDVHWLATTMFRQGRPDIPPRAHALRLFASEFVHPAAYDYVDRRDLRPVLVALRAAVARSVTDLPGRLYRAMRNPS